MYGDYISRVNICEIPEHKLTEHSMVTCELRAQKHLAQCKKDTSLTRQKIQTNVTKTVPGPTEGKHISTSR